MMNESILLEIRACVKQIVHDFTRKISKVSLINIGKWNDAFSLRKSISLVGCINTGERVKARFDRRGRIAGEAVLEYYRFARRIS